MPETDAVWSADVYGLRDGVMELRVRPAEPGGLPAWQPGTAVDCTVDTGADAHCAAATVARQAGPRVWLRVPGEWQHADRRASPRLPGGFPVRYQARGEYGVGECVDISQGGMCLEAAEPLFPGETLDLLFLLPGDLLHASARGTVVWARAAGAGVRVGLSFTLVLPIHQDRIAQYCRSAEVEA